MASRKFASGPAVRKFFLDLTALTLLAFGGLCLVTAEAAAAHPTNRASWLVPQGTTGGETAAAFPTTIDMICGGCAIIGCSPNMFPNCFVGSCDHGGVWCETGSCGCAKGTNLLFPIDCDCALAVVPVDP